MKRDAASHRRRGGFAERPRLVFLLAFAAFFAAIAVWSLATPLGDAPDEPAHVAKAAAVVRGELIGQLVGGPSSPDGIVRIPAAYAGLGALVQCYQFKANEPASCAPAYHGSARIVSDEISNARYQPLYYAIVGIPSLFTDSEVGIYLMRLLSGALSALFLALAVMAAVTWGRSRLLLAGIVVAATPSVLSLAGVVNPSGFETSVAICLWTGALILVRERLADPPAGLVLLVGASAGVEALVRSLSPFWVAFTLLVALAVADWALLARFLRWRPAWLAGGFVAVCGAWATGWILLEHSLNVLPPSAPVPASVHEGQLLVMGLLRTPLYFTEMVSRFGWLVAPSPALTYLIWAGLIGLLVVLGLASASWRHSIVLLLLVVAVVAIPVLIATGQAHRLGITWQGKDTLPLAVGVPILSASMLAGSGLRSLRPFVTRTVGIVAGSAGLGVLVALWGELRRNAVGDNGPAVAFFRAGWQPPLGIGGVLLLGVVATAALTAVFGLLGLAEGSSRWAGAPPLPAAMPPAPADPMDTAVPAAPVVPAAHAEGADNA